MEPLTKPLVVVNLGRSSRKRIRRLKRGEGPLVRDVRDTLADLRATGRVSEGAEAVVFLVQKRRKGASTKGLRMPMALPMPKCFA